MMPEFTTPPVTLAKLLPPTGMIWVPTLGWARSGARHLDQKYEEGADPCLPTRSRSLGRVKVDSCVAGPRDCPSTTAPKPLLVKPWPAIVNDAGALARSIGLGVMLVTHNAHGRVSCTVSVTLPTSGQPLGPVWL
jgi:hypothetical protein